MGYARRMACRADLLVAPLKTESERQSDFEKGMGYHEIDEGYRSHNIGWETGTLLMSDGPV